MADPSGQGHPIALIQPQVFLCSEYCHEVSVDYSKKYKDDKLLIWGIVEAVIAQINTSGGVVSITGSSQVGDTVLDKWKQGLDEQLKARLSRDCYLNCIKLAQEPSSLKIHIISKIYPNLVTFDYGMVTRGNTGNIEVTDLADAVGIMRQKTMPQIVPFRLQNIRYHAPVSLAEGPNVEFKCWKTKGVDEIMSRMTQDRTQKVLFGMPNLLTGGHVIIGIKEDESTRDNIIEGQLLEQSEEGHLTEGIEDLLKYDPDTGESRIWGSEGTTPVRGTHWDVSYLPVQNCPNNKRRVLIVIELRHCEEGVFMYKPQANCLANDGKTIQEMTFTDWQNHVITTHPMSVTKPDSSSAYPSQQSSIPQREFPKLKNYKPRKNERQKITEIIPNPSLDYKKILSFSNDNRLWRTNVEAADAVSLESVLTSINTHTHTGKVQFIPEEETVIKSNQKLAAMLTQLISQIKIQCSSKTTIIVSREWLKHVEPPGQTGSAGITKPAHHLMDFMCINKGCGMMIISGFLHKADQADMTQYIGYVRQLAILTKKYILSHTNCKLSAGQSIYIEARVWVSGEGFCDTSSFLDTQCKQFMAGRHDHWKIIHDTIWMLILSKNTNLRRSKGDECLIRLTMEQMELLLRADLSQFNLIEGPPGSGKTLLAIYLYRQFKNGKCRILCKNPSLKAFLEYQECHTSLVTTDADLMTFTKEEQFTDLECLVIDDCHNLDLEPKTWKILFEILIKNGIYLYLFMDNDIQRYQSLNNPLRQVFLKYCAKFGKKFSHSVRQLNTVHRNTMKIVGFLKAGFQEKNIKCGHQEEGDDVEMRTVNNLRSSDSKNGLLLLITDLMTNPGTTSPDVIRYEARDIAVLIDGKDPLGTIRFYRDLFDDHLEGIKTQQSDKFPVTGIVVDHVDRFGGLDAKVCILVNHGDPSNYQEMKSRCFSNTQYKAFVASRGIYRVIFVTETIDANMADEMYIDPTQLADEIKQRRIALDYRSLEQVMEYRGGEERITPVGLAVCPRTGNVIVSNLRTDRIHVLSPKLEQITVFGGRGEAEGEYKRPCGVAVNSQGVVYISDNENHRIQVTDLSGHVRFVITETTGTRTQLRNPQGLAIDNSDGVWLCDTGGTGTDRVLVMSGWGGYVREFTLLLSGRRAGPRAPKSIVLTDSCVAVGVYNYVQILTLEGTPIHSITTESMKRIPYFHHDLGCVGLAFDMHGNLLVCDGGGVRVISEHGQGQTVCRFAQDTVTHMICLMPDGSGVLICDSLSESIKLYSVSNQTSVQPSSASFSTADGS